MSVALALVIALLCTSCVEKIDEDRGAQSPTATSSRGDDRNPTASVVEQFAGERMSFGVVPSAPEAASGDPILVGMINQEDTPLGSFPELRLGAQAAVEFINQELGGVGGRPIELVACITSFSVERSQSCAQTLVQRGVVAVLGGIDITSNGSIPVLERNETPYVGGIPVNFDEMRSPISFQFSGGAPGAFVAFAEHAARVLGARRVVVAYGDYESIRASAIDYGVRTLRRRGVEEITEIAFPITSTDFLPVLTKAKQADPDAIFLGAADSACAPAMKTSHELGLSAKLYLVGACAAPKIATSVGEDAVEGRIFNVEGPIDPQNREGQLYFAVTERYGDPNLPAQSAATVTFRSMMNLYALLDELGPDGISRQSLLELLRSTRKRPSFNGHDYTCDGKQVPGLPALCAPQQILVERRSGAIVPVSDWIDVPAVLREVLER